jgi:hypothetical protein
MRRRELSKPIKVNRWLTVSWSNRGDINDDDGEEEE